MNLAKQKALWIWKNVLSSGLRSPGTALPSSSKSDVSSCDSSAILSAGIIVGSLKLHLCRQDIPCTHSRPQGSDVPAHVGWGRLSYNGALCHLPALPPVLTSLYLNCHTGGPCAQWPPGTSSVLRCYDSNKCLLHHVHRSAR